MDEQLSSALGLGVQGKQGAGELHAGHGSPSASTAATPAASHQSATNAPGEATADASTAPVPAAAPLTFSESTPLSEIAQALQDLEEDELRARRARLTARLASLRLPPRVRLTITRQRDAIEWLQHQRQLARGEAPSALAAAPTGDELFAVAPLQGANDLEVGARARLESAARTGGAREVQATYLHLGLRGTPEQAAALDRQLRALSLEHDAFRAELRSTALRTAQEMLDASTREIEGALLQYGLSGGSFRLTTAAREYLRDPDSLPRLIAEWRTLSHAPERAGATQRGAASQAELADTVTRLRAQKARAEELEREERNFTEQDWMRRDAVDPDRSSQQARAELADTWLAAETEHPVLLAFRDPTRGADPDRLTGLAAGGGGMEEAVLRQAIPKLGNILRTKQELGTGHLDPMRLAPVLEVAKQRLLVPPGSPRAALVADLHREATRTPLAQHVLSALSIGLAILSFVPGVGLGAKLLGEAASLALELHAQVHEYKEWRTAGGMNNTALDMARSVSLDAPGLRPLLLRLAVAGAGSAGLLQLGRLALRLEHARQLGGAAGAAGAADSAEDVLRELDALGDSVGVRRLGEQVDAVGGVRGVGVYGKKSFVKNGVERFSKLNLEKVKDGLKKVVARAHIHGARLEAKVAEATADAATGTLRIPAPTATADGAARAGAVEIQVELRFQGELAPSAAHGADAGPARYMLEKSTDTRWIARIEIDQHLDPRDVEFVISHELDEISELVHRFPAGKPAIGFESEMAAGVMRQGATTARATAHDVANARELVALQRDYEHLLTTRSPNAPARKAMLDRAIESAGLGEASQIDAKVKLLREAGAPEELLDRVRRVEATRLMKEHMNVTTPAKLYVNEDLVDHVLWPRDRSRGLFVERGMEGGHHTQRLLDCSWPHGNYVFVEVAARPAGGSIARRFDQYMWTGHGPVPIPGSGAFPTDKHFNPAGWVKSKMPKTTFDDPSALLREGEEAFQDFIDAHGGKIDANARTFKGTSKSGVEMGGYVIHTPDGPVPTTMFVEASWL